MRKKRIQISERSWAKEIQSKLNIKTRIRKKRIQISERIISFDNSKNKSPTTVLKFFYEKSQVQDMVSSNKLTCRVSIARGLVN